MANTSPIPVATAARMLAEEAFERNACEPNAGLPPNHLEG
jgi:hypothetical protein